MREAGEWVEKRWVWGPGCGDRIIHVRSQKCWCKQDGSERLSGVGKENDE